MPSYTQQIENTRLVANVEATLTTGDLDYDGTAIEVCDELGNELFHVVVDSGGERQFRFFRTSGDYRLPLELMEEIVKAAKDKVRKCDPI